MFRPIGFGLFLIVLLSVASVAATPPVKGLDSMNFTALDGSSIDRSTLDGKVVLFVNVASKCGLTPQYEGLQKLYDAKKADGLVVVGVPCNQFGGQEPGTAEQIATFCSMNYGVTFPLLEKQAVNGSKRSPLYSWLIGSKEGGGKDIGWNFEKFVIGRDGEVAARFAPSTAPDDSGLVAAIDEALAKGR